MRRSGSTVQYHLAREIVKLGGGIDLGWRIWQDFDRLYAKYSGEYPYAILKSHTHIPSMSKMCEAAWGRDECYGIFSHRDVRDIMASIIRLYKAQGATAALDTPNLENDMRAVVLFEGVPWFRTKNVLATRYEDLLSFRDLEYECLRISEHIGIAVTDDQCADIARAHMLERQRERLGDTSGRYNGEYFMWKNHIFSGENGRWVDELSPAQVAFCASVASHLPVEMGRE
jgi:hypothetical protein